VTVEQGESGGRATFYLQAVRDAAPLQMARVDFSSADGLDGPWPVKLGGRHTSDGHNWDGVIDQAAVFGGRLSEQDIRRLFAGRLRTTVVQDLTPLAFWSFDEAADPGASDLRPNSLAAEHRLAIPHQPSRSPQEFGLGELCHVLLNCNEFVYLD